jgi:Zn-finger nucleic acid-binding protein
MTTCPTCATPLRTHADVPQGGQCPTCRGQLLPFAMLRREAPAGALDGLWSALLAAPVGRRACPRCAGPMQAVFKHGVEIDGCALCHHVWLDPGEREGLTGPARPGTATPQERAMTEAEGTRIVAEAQSKAIGERYAREERIRRTAWWLEGIENVLWFLH